MSRISFVRLPSILALTFWASTSSASIVIYAVGTCKPHLHSYRTISAALAAAPSANVIDVCPGTYDEQLQIIHPVTLEGVSNGTSARAVITPPARGLVTNATDDIGEALAVQLWVNNASGPVNISNITVDGSGNLVQKGPFNYVVGIFYQNSGGTVNQVATRNQVGSSAGVGIWAEGGSSNPLVTIENSSVHDYDFMGIEVETTISSTPELFAVIKENKITTSVAGSNSSGQNGIDILSGTAVVVTGNLIVNPGLIGIWSSGGVTGSISGNTVANGSFAGIASEAEDVSVTSNNILRSAAGIYYDSGARKPREALQSNTITDSPIGIDFVCSADANVHSNIISDARIALYLVPPGVATNNTYFNVGTIRDRGGC